MPYRFIDRYFGQVQLFLIILIVGMIVITSWVMFSFRDDAPVPTPVSTGYLGNASEAPQTLQPKQWRTRTPQPRLKPSATFTAGYRRSPVTIPSRSSKPTTPPPSTSTRPTPVQTVPTSPPPATVVPTSTVKIAPPPNRNIESEETGDSDAIG